VHRQRLAEVEELVEPFAGPINAGESVLGGGHGGRPRAVVLVFAPQAFGCGSPKSAREVKPRPIPPSAATRRGRAVSPSR
jgi:hypothetical protein